MEFQTTKTQLSQRATVRIKKGMGRSLKAGGAWIYDNEIDIITGSFTNGELALIEDYDGFPLGTGFINTCSKLTVRMMSRNKVARPRLRVPLPY